MPYVAEGESSSSLILGYIFSKSKPYAQHVAHHTHLGLAGDVEGGRHAVRAVTHDLACGELGDGRQLKAEVLGLDLAEETQSARDPLGLRECVCASGELGSRMELKVVCSWGSGFVTEGGWSGVGVACVAHDLACGGLGDGRQLKAQVLGLDLAEGTQSARDPLCMCVCECLWSIESVWGERVG